MLIQIARTAARKNVHHTKRFFTSNNENNVKKITNVKFHQSDQSIHFYLLSNDATDQEWNDPSMKFILCNSQYNKKQVVKQLDISQGLSIQSNIAAQIEKHYCIESSNQFVGGMGENDGGVWISAISTLDTLDYWDDIKDIVQQVKEKRHGVPFGVHTSGIVKDVNVATKLKTDLGLSSIQVSLLSSDPQSYASIRGIQDMSKAQQEFGQVCNFIATAAESGFPVTAAVAGGKHARGGGELAKSLGAVDTIVYDL